MDSKIAKLCELLTIPDSIKDDDILAAELIKIDEVFKVVFKLLKEFRKFFFFLLLVFPRNSRF